MRTEGLSDTARNIIRWLREAYPDGEVRVIERVPAAVIWVRVIDESFGDVPFAERDDIFFERLQKVSNHHKDVGAVYGVCILLTEAERDEVQSVLDAVRKVVGGDGDLDVTPLLQRACDVLQFESATQTMIPASFRIETAGIDITASVLDNLWVNMRVLPEPDAASKCRDIGRDLHSVGGLPLMQAVWYRMNELDCEAAARLQFVWDGVGDWAA